MCPRESFFFAEAELRVSLAMSFEYVVAVVFRAGCWFIDADPILPSGAVSTLTCDFDF